MYYLDYNATSPLRDNVKQAIYDILDIYGNPSSVHFYGRKARSIIENVRDKTADYLGILPQNIIFTGSATEANHLLLRGLSCDAIITSAAEHDSVLSAITHTQAFKNQAVYYIDHLPDGRLSRESFDTILQTVTQKHQKPLLSLMKVNNETGVITDLEYFSAKIRAVNGYVHSDCVQAIGKISFDDWLWQCDAITLAGHKVGGAKGMGILVLRENIALSPLLTGGGQEMRRRAGTENTLSIHAWGALMDILCDKQIMRNEYDYLLNLQEKLETDMITINPNAIIVGQTNSRVPNTICVITQGLEAEKQVIIADLSKVSISSGSACSSGKVKPSHVLNAYGYGVSQAMSAIRISMGFASCSDDCEAFLKAYKTIVSKIDTI
jgi:cysteine desulfurase